MFCAQNEQLILYDVAIFLQPISQYFTLNPLNSSLALRQVSVSHRKISFKPISMPLILIYLSFQTCYEMERYLRDEPKLQSVKKLPSDMESAWFATPTNGWKVEVDCLDDFSERHLDALSTSSGSSACSWDSALSCAVLVKQVMFCVLFMKPISCYWIKLKMINIRN